MVNKVGCIKMKCLLTYQYPACDIHFVHQKDVLIFEIRKLLDSQAAKCYFRLGEREVRFLPANKYL